MLSEGQEDREKRFKAMLQYLILRKVFEFDDRLILAQAIEAKR